MVPNGIVTAIQIGKFLTILHVSDPWYNIPQVSRELSL